MSRFKKIKGKQKQPNPHQIKVTNKQNKKATLFYLFLIIILNQVLFIL